MILLLMFSNFVRILVKVLIISKNVVNGNSFKSFGIMFFVVCLYISVKDVVD